MADELAKEKNSALVTTIEQHGIGELLKPLIREIYLFESYVAGTTHLKDPTVLEEVRAGDRLRLLRENNKYDKNAILLFTETGKKLGYVPAKDNLIFARLMDAGKKLTAKITSIETEDSFHYISIGIYLVDF